MWRQPHLIPSQTGNPTTREDSTTSTCPTSPSDAVILETYWFVNMSEICANPLLLEWIKEWLDQARERNSKGVTVSVLSGSSLLTLANPRRYKKAYESMKACPLVFQHPSQAQQLNGLGPKLCDRLTEKLKGYCDENGLPMPEHPQKGRLFYACLV